MTNTVICGPAGREAARVFRRTRRAAAPRAYPPASRAARACR